MTQPLLLLLQLPLGLPGLAMPGTACRPHACVRAFIILLCPKFQGFKPCPASGNGRFPDFADLTPVTGAPPATQKRCEQHGKGQDITKHHCQKQKTARNTCRRCRSEATQQTSYEPLQLATMLTGATNCWLKVGSMLRARSSRSVKRKLRSFPGPVRNDETIRPSDPKRTTKTHPKRPTNIHVLVPRNPSKEY